jgi:LCP family protein required for cell wall assembly
VSTDPAPAAHHPTRGQRAFIAAAILAFAAASAYLALVIITRVDHIFFPGNELKLGNIPAVGGALDVAPGIDSQGESGSQERINILVLGLDRRPSEGQIPSRTDTIFVVTLDPKSDSAGILGIPRDGLVDIPLRDGGTYAERINTVYAQGEDQDYPGGGIGLMRDVIRNNFNIDIDHHVLVDFEGFQEIVDALGGIDVDVPDYVYDPYYSWTELPGDYDPQEFEVGRQHMDGRTALAYSRIRFSSDDLDRIQRQQRVIFAAIEKGKSLNVLTRADDLWSEYNDSIETDISDIKVAGYALLADQVKDNIHAVSLGPATVPHTGDQGQAFQVFDWPTVEDLVASLFEDRAPGIEQPVVESKPARVQFQNGTATDALAANVLTYVATRGYRVEDMSSANAYDDQLHDVSEIIDLTGTFEKNRLQLARWLGIPPDRARLATDAEAAALNGVEADIIVILGTDVDFDDLIQSPTTTTPGG